MDKLEQLDRRAFLRGMMLTSAGVLVPKPARVFVPEMRLPPLLFVPNSSHCRQAWKVFAKGLIGEYQILTYDMLKEAR